MFKIYCEKAVKFIAKETLFFLGVMANNFLSLLVFKRYQKIIKKKVHFISNSIEMK